jgi:hypothetical protein
MIVKHNLDVDKIKLKRILSEFSFSGLVWGEKSESCNFSSIKSFNKIWKMIVLLE